MSSTVLSALMRFLLKLVFLFEPLTPRVIDLFLNIKLKEWKGRKLIDDYRSKTKRMGKFHYKTDIDLELTPKQVRKLLRNLRTRVS